MVPGKTRVSDTSKIRSKPWDIRTAALRDLKFYMDVRNGMTHLLLDRNSNQSTLCIFWDKLVGKGKGREEGKKEGKKDGRKNGREGGSEGGT